MPNGSPHVSCLRLTYPPLEDAYQLNNSFISIPYHKLDFTTTTMPKFYAKLEDCIQKALDCLNYQKKPNIAAAAQEF